MVTRLTVTIANSISEFIESNKGTNRSEFVEELLRLGKEEYLKKRTLNVENSPINLG